MSVSEARWTDYGKVVDNEDTFVCIGGAKHEHSVV